MEKSRGSVLQKLRGSALIINALPPKFLKIVATRGEIFSLKFTKYRLAAWLRPDPLGELKHSPYPLAAISGGLLLRGREGGGKGGMGKGRGRGGEELAPRCRGDRRPCNRVPGTVLRLQRSFRLHKSQTLPFLTHNHKHG